MIEYVLTVARSVLELAEKLDKARADAAENVLKKDKAISEKYNK